MYNYVIYSCMYSKASKKFNLLLSEWFTFKTDKASFFLQRNVFAFAYFDVIRVDSIHSLSLFNFPALLEAIIDFKWILSKEY